MGHCRFLPDVPVSTFGDPMPMLSAFRRASQNALGIYRLRRTTRRAPRRVVIGPARTDDAGWAPSHRSYLNLLVEAHWLRAFRPESLDALMAEHVWEHLTAEEGAEAARRCFRYLRPGGYLRVAVPDGLSPRCDAEREARLIASGHHPVGHRVLFTYRTFSALFEAAGFRTELLEHYDEDGRFVATEWDPARGLVWRSARFDPRNRDGELQATSIILDAHRD